MKTINYLLCLTLLLCSLLMIRGQICNSGEYYDSTAKGCKLCSSKTLGCILCDQSSGECLVCSGLFLSWSNPGSTTSVCLCPSKQLQTYNPQTDQYSCANSTVANSYYNETQLASMTSQLSLQNLQVIEAAILGVNGVENQTLTKLNNILSIVQKGSKYVLLQNQTSLNQLARVLTSFAYVYYSNANILSQVSSIASQLIVANQSNYITINQCMEVFGLVFDKLTSLTYQNLPTSFFANIQNQFDDLSQAFMQIKYIDLGFSQQLLTNHYTNIWIASIWLDLNTSFYVVSDLALDYSLSLSSTNLTGLTSGSLYVTQIVTEKSPIAYFPGNSQKLQLLSGVQNLQFFQLQNSILVNINSQLLANPQGMLLGFPSSTKNTPYFVNWDISLEEWEENFACTSQNNHAFCIPNLQLAANSFSFSISEKFKYSEICNAGEYQINATKCGLCNEKTNNCVSCNVFNGECSLCKGLFPTFSNLNGTITCNCPSGNQLILNITTNEYQCVSQAIANQLYTTYLPIIQNYTSALTSPQLKVLQSLALALNGNNILSKFQVIINILLNGEADIINTSDASQFLQYLKVLLALAYNSDSSFTVLQNVGNIVNQIRIAPVIQVDEIYYFMEIFGLIDEKILSTSFSWDNATKTQISQFILLTQTYLDNMKRTLAMQVNFNQSSLLSFHFTNFYASLQIVNVTKQYGSGLLLNQYAVEIAPTILSKIPQNNTVYAVHLLQEKNAFSLLNSSNATLFTNVQDITFYYSDKFLVANGYLNNMSQQYAQMLYPYEVIQTYKMQLVDWSFSRSSWKIIGYCSQTSKTVASCYPTALDSNLFAVAKNTTTSSQSQQTYQNQLLRHFAKPQ